MNTVTELEQQAKDLKEIIDRRDLALKLEKNREFRKLILEDFCTTECARYVQLSADPALSTENRADALALAQAAGHLRRFLSVVVRMGNQAEHELTQVNESLEEARREEV